MAQQTLKKLQYDGSDVVVEVAKRDINGAQIDTTYLKKAQLTEGDGIDISDSNGNKVVAIEKTSSSNLGGMITGTGLTAANDGTVSLNTATASAIGGIKIGTGLSISSGTASVVQAAADTLGGIKLGTGLTYNSTSGKVDVSSAAWSGVTSKPFSEVDSGTGKTFTITSDKLYVNTDVMATKDYVSSNFLGINTTLPATNVIPTQTTANKVLLSTTTSGTAAWSSGALSSSATKPLYLNSSGVLTAGNTYAGGTAVTLNGTSKAGSTASFYAPTDDGGTTVNRLFVSKKDLSSSPAWSGVTTWGGSAGFLKVDAFGSTSVDTNTYLTSHQSLSNYYTKSEVDGLVNGINPFTYETASELPTAAASTMYKIYLIPASNSDTNNAKEEYITIDNGANATTRYTWEHIGSTNVDLSSYAQVSGTLTYGCIVFANDNNKTIKGSSFQVCFSATSDIEQSLRGSYIPTLSFLDGRWQPKLTFSTGLTNSSQTVTLNTASASTLGGVKIGDGITISSGVISATPAWSAITSNPFTVTDVTLDY